MNADAPVITPATELSRLIEITSNAPLSGGALATIVIVCVLSGFVIFVVGLRNFKFSQITLGAILTLGSLGSPMLINYNQIDAKNAVCKAAAGALIVEQDENSIYQRLKRFRSSQCDGDFLTAAVLSAPEHKRQALSLLLSRQ